MPAKPKSLKKVAEDILNTIDDELKKEIEPPKAHGVRARNPAFDAQGHRIPAAIRKARAEEIARLNRQKWLEAQQEEKGRQRRTGEGTPGTHRDREEHPLRYEGINEAANNPNTVKNCKRSNTMGNKLSSKCRRILHMKGEQVNPQSLEGHVTGMPYTDLNVVWIPGRRGDADPNTSNKCENLAHKYGEELQESEKYYVDIYMKGWAGKQEVIAQTDKTADNSHLGSDTFESLLPIHIYDGGPYEVGAADCYTIHEPGALYTMAPILSQFDLDHEELKSILMSFYNDPVGFMKNHNNVEYELILIKRTTKPQDVLEASESKIDPTWDVNLDVIGKARKHSNE